MKIEFADADVAQICTAKAFKLGLPIGVINSARRKLAVLHAAPDERTLRNWKSLNYKKRTGDKLGRRTIRLNNQYRLVFTLDETKNPPVITIFEIGDTHD